MVLRRNIEELRHGQADFANMSVVLANITRQQLPQLQRAINELGELESLTFKGIDAQGRDVYEAKFSKGSARWQIRLMPDGKLANATFQRIQ